MVSLFKDAVLHPEKIGRAKSLSKGKAFLYLTILSLVFLLPLSFQVVRILEHLDQDGLEIAERIPDFEIQDNRLVGPPEVNSYIHNTGTLSFIYDPNGELDTDDVDNVIVESTSFIGIALLEEALYFNASLYTFTQPYSQFEHFTPNQIKGPLHALGEFNVASAILFAIVFWLFGLVNLMIELLIFTLFGNIFASISGVHQRFGETWNTILVASTIPTIFFALLDLFNLSVPFQLEAKGAIVLYLFYLAFKSDHLKNINKKN